MLTIFFFLKTIDFPHAPVPVFVASVIYLPDSPARHPDHHVPATSDLPSPQWLRRAAPRPCSPPTLAVRGPRPARQPPPPPAKPSPPPAGPPPPTPLGIGRGGWGSGSIRWQGWVRNPRHHVFATPRGLVWWFKKGGTQTDQTDGNS